MASTAIDTAHPPRRGIPIARIVLFALLGLFALVYLLPFFIMVITSLKSLDEIRAGNLLSLPQSPTVQPWIDAWGKACIGVTCEGINGYFWNSVRMAVPAVALSTLIGALNGYVVTKWRFPGADLIFALILFGCFIPFQIVLIPMARTLGLLHLAGTVKGLVLVHVVYGIGFTTLFFRNYSAAFPVELVRSARMDGAGFWRLFARLLLPNSGPIIVVSVIWQFTNIWNDFLFGASFSDYSSFPVTVALNNLVNSSTGVKEYNVHFAAAFIAGAPTLAVYLLSGKYFVRGLMAGSVKG
jgi:glucose/mannose transport system permease protein